MLREFDLQVPRSTIAKWLHAPHIRFGEKKLSGSSASDHTQRFVREYAAALAEEEKDEAMIVWMDESYIHVGITTSRGWYIEGVKPKRGANKFLGQAKGECFIIIHAMTKFSMLETKSAVPTADMNERCSSAMVVESWLAAGDVAPEDYHHTLNNERFIAWMKNRRLLVAFRAKFPGKKMTLMMDNAGFHHRAATTG